MANTADPWRPLKEGDHDPCYREKGRWCYAKSGKLWVCSRAPGHQGPHVAGDYLHRVLEVWGGSPEQTLPEGF